MEYQTLLVSVEEKVATIRLNRPEALNALNSALLAELAAALGALDADPGVHAIVLTGSEKAFAAGADVREMSEKSFAEVFGEEMFNASFDAIGRCRKPIIAAVAGFCLGGGCELAMACDFVIAADSAKFGQPEINLGIIPGLGGTQRLPRLVGRAKAMDLILTGRFMEAEEAERAGLAARVVPAADLLAEADKAARAIAAKSPVAVKAAKEAVHRAEETPLREGVLFERRLFQALFATADQKEGMAAFLAKRAPRFEGR
ncbi:enoyl-CoA hydratase-related protein [Amaricoccus solimangrovi]|uniref:enoyl-CoA hydratase n=1 Tax=Amaricoccus solimangrovi TaxID=2589815 RepID=A0A501WLP0_9RHOB|nr:enoyl-CoA hydratase-related protein [Amaricoccus solimangrovi]TPE49702.1 enoyl-CoA hydratase [Amaricoccus solimangrovi]